MGMTIEETISDLTELKICGVMPFSKGTLSGGDYKVITNECIDVAIDVMRKYQKIEELAEYHMIRFLSKERMSGFQKDILEVLEDGSTN